MMKNLVVKPTVPALILALAMGLALASCADPVRPEPAEDLPEGRGLARIQLSAGEPAQSVRTAVPNMADLHFTLCFTAEGKTPVNETLDGSSSLTLDVALPYADWTLKVKGYTDAGHTPANLTATGTISFSVTAGESASVVVYLTPNVSSGETGSLEYNISFPATARGHLALYPIDNTPETSREIDLLDTNAGTLSLTGEIYQMVGTSTLNEGVYRAVIDLYDSVGNKAATRTEVAHIYADLPTPLERTFVPADFAECPPVAGKDLTTLADKLNAALSSPEGPYTIVLSGGTDLSSFDLNAGDKKITIILRGNGETVQLDNGGSLFTLGATSGSLTLELRDITLKGTDTNNSPLVTVNSGGTLVMKAGSLITGNCNSNESLSGGGVYVNNGTFTKSGGTIYGSDTDNSTLKNTASVSGHAVYVSTVSKARNTTAGPGVNLNSDTDENWEP